MKVTLKDGAPRCVGTVEINVSKNANTVEIGATGVEPAPVVLEFYGGKLTLRLFDEAGKPTVVQVVNTTPNVKAEPVAAAAEPVTVTTLLAKAISDPAGFVESLAPAPAADFDEAAFDAA